MEKYAIKEQLNKIIADYEKQALDRNLVFRIQVDSDLPTVLSGEIELIMDVINLLLEEAFSHTQEGKIVLSISCIRESESSSARYEVGSYIPIRIEIMDTGNYYDLESERVKNGKAKLIFLDSSLHIENRDKLGAKIAFDVLVKVESEKIVDAYNYVIKNRIEDISVQEKIEQIEGIDWDKGLAYVQGNQTVYEQFLLEYVKSSVDFLKRLSDFFAAKDMANYRIVAHSIKSNSYYVGANELGDFAKEMEFAARDMDVDFILKMHEVFKESYSQIVRNIEAYLTGKGIVVDFIPETDKDKLILAIDNFEQEKALELLDQISAKECNKEVADEIRMKLEDFDYFGAGELVGLL